MKYLLTVLFLISQFSLASAQRTIGWLAHTPVASKVYGNLHPRLALDKHNNPMAVWGDENGKIYFSRWGGESFMQPVDITPNNTVVFVTSWSGPDIASHGDTVYIVYKVVPEDKNHIYMIRSYDGGQHFSVPDQVDVLDNRYINRFPTVSVDENGMPYVAFMRADRDHNGHRIVVARSDDMGENFYKDTLASIGGSGNVCECSPAALVVSGSAGMLLYRNNLHGERNIWVGISNDGAKSFINGIQVDSVEYRPDACPASAPSGIILGDTLYTVYMSGPTQESLVYLTKVSLSQPSITVAPITGNLPGVVIQNFPRISGMGNAGAAVWTQTAGGNNQVCLSLTDDLTKGFTAKVDTVADGVMLNADVAMGGGFVYVVWEDHIERCVMMRRGVYVNKGIQVQKTSLLIQQPEPGQKYFFISLPDIVSCAITDTKGTEVELDLVYPKNDGECRVDLTDVDPGIYSLKVWDKDGKIYNAKLEVR